MRLYVKPQLDMEPFNVADLITLSDPGSPDPGFEEEMIDAPAPMIDAAASNGNAFPQSTVADPSGAFQQQVTGGNPIQEGLNNLYENFLNRF